MRTLTLLLINLFALAAAGGLLWYFFRGICWAIYV